MTVKSSHSALSATTIAALRNTTEEELLNSIAPADWFYSHSLKKFIARVESLDVNLTHPTVKSFSVNSEEVTFLLPGFSTLYEVSWSKGFNSAILLSSNLEALIGEHLDVTDDLDFLLTSDISAPMLLGNKASVDRLTLDVQESKFFRASVTDYLKGRDK